MRDPITLRSAVLALALVSAACAAPPSAQRGPATVATGDQTAAGSSGQGGNADSTARLAREVPSCVPIKLTYSTAPGAVARGSACGGTGPAAADAAVRSSVRGTIR